VSTKVGARTAMVSWLKMRGSEVASSRSRSGRRRARHLLEQLASESVRRPMPITETVTFWSFSWPALEVVVGVLGVGGVGEQQHVRVALPALSAWSRPARRPTPM